MVRDSVDLDDIIHLGRQKCEAIGDQMSHFTGYGVLGVGVVVETTHPKRGLAVASWLVGEHTAG